MTTLFEILASAEGKMAAVYKKKSSDKSLTALFKGLLFSCDSLALSTNGNIISLTDETGAEAAQFNIDTEHLTNLDFKAKKDKYGARSVKFNIADENYIIQFA